MKNDVHPTMKPVQMLCYLVGNLWKRNAVELRQRLDADQLQTYEAHLPLRQT